MVPAIKAGAVRVLLCDGAVKRLKDDRNEIVAFGAVRGSAVPSGEVRNGYFAIVPSSVSKMIVTRLWHLGHLICLKAWMLSCLGRYMMERILVTKLLSFPDH